MSKGLEIVEAPLAAGVRVLLNALNDILPVTFRRHLSLFHPRIVPAQQRHNIHKTSKFNHCTHTNAAEEHVRALPYDVSDPPNLAMPWLT